MEQPFREAVNHLLTHACSTHLNEIVQIFIEFSSTHAQNCTFKWSCFVCI